MKIASILTIQAIQKDMRGNAVVLHKASVSVVYTVYVTELLFPVVEILTIIPK